MVHVCRGHRPIVDTCANEGIPQWGKRRLITSVYLQFRLSWQGAKPRTPTREILILHGCRNLRFSSISFSTLFAWYFYSHGEGLSREPYRDYSSCFGTYLMAFRVSSHDGHFGVPSIIRMILLRLLSFPSNLHMKGLSS